MLDQITSITTVPPKYWQPFDATSPGGVAFTGYVCRQESEKLGMLAMTSVGGKERLEFIYAMPKIHYPYQQDRHGQMQLVIPVPQNVTDARFTIKLDGTAIIWWPLTDAEGNVLEVVPRTRLQPVLTPSRWGDWNKLLAEALPDKSGVERAVREQGVVLAFELWGYRNPHLIKYETPLAITLHTAIRHKKIVSHRLLADMAGRFGFNLVESIEVARPDSTGLAEAYRRWQEKMEERNKSAGEGVFVDEGAVLVISTTETATYYKCKPPSIEEIHWAVGRHISKEIVRQVLYKMLENGYDFDAGKAEDAMTELEADFQPPEIEGEADLIRKVWNEFTLELQKQAWLRGLVDASGLDPRDLPNMMRYLSQHYPKKEMSWVYGTVKSLYGG
ncbi:MAG: hypothetical protein HY260_22935 [Chloroflexi bacterium]|nr:hypothetical protein [Chloroflexota bacterium]